MRKKMKKDKILNSGNVSKIFEETIIFFKALAQYNLNNKCA